MSDTMLDLRYTESDRTHPVIEYTDGSNVDLELQDIMNDFVYRVFFSSDSAIQRLLARKEEGANIRAMVTSDVDSALKTLRAVYSDIAPRLRASSVDASFIGGSKLVVRIELNVDDTGGSPVTITHSFNTLSGM